MRHLARYLLAAEWIISLILCIGVCVLWVRSRSGEDIAEFIHFRRLSDGTGRTVTAELSSDLRHIWLQIGTARAEPQTGSMIDVTRYHLPYTSTQREWFSRTDTNPPGWGPMRWYFALSRQPIDPFDSRYVQIGSSHWLLALLFVRSEERPASRVCGVPVPRASSPTAHRAVRELRV